jgi:hypothetical protein
LNLESTIYSAIVTFTVAPLGAPLNNVASPRTFPKTFTGLYARGWSPVLTGVGPKKIHYQEEIIAWAEQAILAFLRLGGRRFTASGCRAPIFGNIKPYRAAERMNTCVG